MTFANLPSSDCCSSYYPCSISTVAIFSSFTHCCHLLIFFLCRLTIDLYICLSYTVGKKLIERHRMVNTVLQDELKASVHALSIQVRHITSYLITSYHSTNCLAPLVLADWLSSSLITPPTCIINCRQCYYYHPYPLSSGENESTMEWWPYLQHHPQLQWRVQKIDWTLTGVRGIWLDTLTGMRGIWLDTDRDARDMTGHFDWDARDLIK